MARQAEVFARIRAMGFSVRKLDGEYQVKAHGKRWDGDATYFTDDLDDALGTACEMAKLRESIKPYQAQSFRVYFTSRQALEAAQKSVRRAMVIAGEAAVAYGKRGDLELCDHWAGQQLVLREALTALETCDG